MLTRIDAIEHTAGSVRGRAHARWERPNQDAWHIARGRDVLVAVVTDGCGSAPFSEVGARVGARLVATAALRSARSGRVGAELARAVERDVLRRLALLTRSMGEDTNDVERDPSVIGDDAAREVVEHHFLFTILAVVITPDALTLFGSGDGLYALDGRVHELGPFEGNAPPYLAHSLLGLERSLVVHARVPTREVGRVLIATDGASALRATIGGLDELWVEDRYYRHRDALRRRLHLLAEDRRRMDWGTGAAELEPGVLDDDTTVIALRWGAR